MTAVSTAQYAAQSAALIAGLLSGSVAPADFTPQWGALLSEWGVSNPALAVGVQTLITSSTSKWDQFANWQAGSPTGGAANVAGTGTGGPYYPLTNATGQTLYVPCLAAQTAQILAAGANSVVIVDNYGAAGDGVTDDHLAVKAAVAATPAGGTLQFGAGKTYNLGSSGISMPLPLKIKGNGATITSTIQFTCFNMVPPSVTYNAGTGTGQFATFNTTQYADSFPIPAGVHITPGCLVWLTSNTARLVQGNTFANGLMAYVRSVVAGVAYIDIGIYGAFEVDQIVVYQPYDEPTVEGLTFKVNGLNSYGINMIAHRFAIRDCQFFDVTGNDPTLGTLCGKAWAGVSVFSAGGVVENSHFQDFQDWTHVSGGRLGYGVAFHGHSITIDNCTSNNNKHSFETGGPSMVDRNMTVQNCTITKHDYDASGQYLHVLGTHANLIGYQCLNNTVSGAGILIELANGEGIIRGNKLIRTEYGDGRASMTFGFEAPRNVLIEDNEFTGQIFDYYAIQLVNPQSGSGQDPTSDTADFANINIRKNRFIGMRIALHIDSADAACVVRNVDFQENYVDCEAAIQIGRAIFSTSAISQTADGTKVSLNNVNAIPNQYVGYRLVTVGGTGVGQSRLITAYDGPSFTATVATAFSPVPDSTTRFDLYAPNSRSINGLRIERNLFTQKVAKLVYEPIYIRSSSTPLQNVAINDNEWDIAGGAGVLGILLGTNDSQNPDATAMVNVSVSGNYGSVYTGLLYVRNTGVALEDLSIERNRVSYAPVSGFSAFLPGIFVQVTEALGFVTIRGNTGRQKTSGVFTSGGGAAPNIYLSAGDTSRFIVEGNICNYSCNFQNATLGPGNVGVDGAVLSWRDCTVKPDGRVVRAAAPALGGGAFPYAVGDVVWNSAPAPAAAPGWICATASVVGGPAAVFKAMPALAA